MKARILFPFLSGILLLSSTNGQQPDNQGYTTISGFGGEKGWKTGTVDGQQGWNVEQGEALIQERDGEPLLVIPPSDPHGQASLYFAPDAKNQPVFVDLTLKMGAGPEGVEFIDANGALASLVRVDSEGRLMARHWEEDGKSGSWMDTTVRLPLDDSGTMLEWTRLTLRQEPASRRWDIYVNGVMKGANFGMVTDERETRGYFTLLGEEKHEVLLRNLAIDYKNPLFADEDQDGIPDDWQKNLAQKNREDDPDADGLTNLEEFLIGTDPSKADTDGDGLTDAEEATSGLDPRTAQESGSSGVVVSFWKADGITRPTLPSNLRQIRENGIFARSANDGMTLKRLEFNGFALQEEDYVSRTRGWIVAPVTGNYTFWIAGDDVAEFWLSTDETPFLSRQTAKARQATGKLDFDSSLPQRSREIRLEAGKRYYFEVQHQENRQDDHFAVAWQIPGKRRAVIGGSFLEPWFPDARDSNDDCLPDDWQEAHGLALAQAESGPQADPDQDHLTNAEEFRLGSDPMKKDAEGRPGLITRELWFGIPGRYLFDTERTGEYPRNPSWTEYLDSFEGPRNVGDNYLARIHGFVKVPETGVYRFHIAGDDQCTLSLGTDADKFTKRQIASVPVNSGWRVWNRFPSQTSEPLNLTQGQILYIEARHKEADGDDYVSVAWTRPGAAEPEIISGSDLISWQPQANDADGNDLPDDWQAGHRMQTDDKEGQDSNFKKMSAFGDADDDGATNNAERLAGTDPLDPASHPAIGLELGFWDGIPGHDLSGLDTAVHFPAHPSRSQVLTNFDYADQGQNYLARARGFVVAPMTADYIFSLAGTDACQLWLSTDESRFNRTLVAEVALATAWRNRTLNARQRSPLIHLEAGKKYYIETLHKKGTGPDHLTVSWMIPDFWQTIILEDFLLPAPADVADADDDGLPDLWESAHGLDPENPSAADGSWGDPDGDLLSNFEEFQHGTDPQRADVSQLRGLALWEVWDSITGLTVDRLTGHPRFPAQPDHRALLQSTEMPQDRGSWYGGRLRGYLVPPVSGKYRLLVSGDDQAALYVSTGEGKFDRRFVAGAPFWTGEREFTRYPDEQADMTLEAGKLYYFELLHKEEGGRDHASLAWIPPGGNEPVILSGNSLAAFTIDPADLDDDELPDQWEAEYGLDARDNGNADPVNGAQGDPDADGLVNLDEWLLGTSPVNRDSDGDGLDDNFEYLVTGTNPAVKDNLTLNPAAFLRAKDGKILSGRTIADATDFVTATPTGTVSFPFSLDNDGTAFFRLAATVLPSAPDVPFTLHLRIDGIDAGIATLVQPQDHPGSASGRLPYLRKGEHNLEISWEVPGREHTIRMESLTLFAVPGTMIADGGRNAVTSPSAESLTSPVCLEGKAAWPELVQVTPTADVIPLPDQAWYANVELPEDGSPLSVRTSFENGLTEAATVVSWKACNILTAGDLIIRAGDALRLTGYPEGQLNTSSRVTLYVNTEQTGITSPVEPVVHLFAEPGTYTVSASFAPAGGGEPTLATIQIKALRADVADPVLLYTGRTRTLSLPGLPTDAEVFPDASLYFLETQESIPRTFTIARSVPGDARVAFRLPGGGPVLKSATVRSLSLASDMDTWYGVVSIYPDGSRLIEMDVFMPDMKPGLRLRVDIIVAGVTFDDGSTTKWLTSEDFDENGTAKIRFIADPSIATSFCHQMTLLDGDTVLGTR